MGKPKTVITENGVVYELSNPKASRTFWKIVGAILFAEGLPMLVIAPLAGLIAVAVGVALFVWLPQKIQPKKTFRSFAGTPCAGNHTFGNWNSKVHRGQAQVDRFEKAVHQPMAIRSYNAQTGYAEIQGSGTDSYMTSLDECTCPDFDKRSRPCKHIYFLAIQMGYTSDDFYSD